MRRLVPLLLIASLSVGSSGCITYVAHSSDPEPRNTAMFLGVDVGLGLATGVGLARKKPERPMWQHLTLGLVTAFALDSVIALLVWQADNKSD